MFVLQQASVRPPLLFGGFSPAPSADALPTAPKVTERAAAAAKTVEVRIRGVMVVLLVTGREAGSVGGASRFAVAT
jgi:hypothetical protein